MDVLDYLNALRRRWRVVAVIAFVAVVAAIVSTPAPAQRSATQPGTAFTATATLLRPPTESLPTVELGLVRLYAKTGEVPRRVAEVVGFDGPPPALAAQVVVAGDDSVGTVTFAVTQRDGDEAARLAEAFAEETIVYLEEAAETQRRASMATIQESLDDLNEQIIALGDEISQASGARQQVLSAQREALLAQYGSGFQQLSQLTSDADAGPPLIVLEEAQPVATATAPTLQAPQGRRSRVLLGLALGLLLGCAAALLVERLDTRLRDRKDAEDAFGLPVVAEIPRLPVWRRPTGVVTISDSAGAVAEAYRGLRAALLLMPSRRVMPSVAGSSASEAQRTQVVLIAGPTARTGKTSTAVNLAACLAETGRSVLILDADLRHPSVHELLSIRNDMGLSDMVAGRLIDWTASEDAGAAGSPEVAHLESVVRWTMLPRTSVVTAGRGLDDAGSLGSAMASLVAQARELADVVVIDSGPLLAGSDALEVIPHADTVVLVGRVRRTTRDQAQRVRELLARLNTPVLGVVLMATDAKGGGPSGSSDLWQRVPFVGARRAARNAHPEEGAASRDPSAVEEQ